MHLVLDALSTLHHPPIRTQTSAVLLCSSRVPCFLTSHSALDVWNVKKYGANGGLSCTTGDHLVLMWPCVLCVCTVTAGSDWIPVCLVFFFFFFFIVVVTCDWVHVAFCAERRRYCATTRVIRDISGCLGRMGGVEWTVTSARLDRVNLENSYQPNAPFS